MTIRASTTRGEEARPVDWTIEISEFYDPFRGDPDLIRLTDDGVTYRARSPEGRVLGYLKVRRRLDDGVWEVHTVDVVDPANRRKGIATSLMEQARRDLGRVDHAPEWRRTHDGAEWSRAVGSLSRDAVAFDDQRAWQLTRKVDDMYGGDGPGPITSVQQAEREMSRLVGPGKQVPVRIDPSVPSGNAHVAWRGNSAVEMVLGQGGVSYIAFLHEVAHLMAGYDGDRRHSEAWARQFGRVLRLVGLDKAAEVWEALWSGNGLDYYYGHTDPPGTVRQGQRIDSESNRFADYGFVYQTRDSALYDAETRWNHEWHEGIEDKVYVYKVKAIGGLVEHLNRPGHMNDEAVHSPGGWRIVGYEGAKAATATKTAATPLADDRYGSPANVRGRPTGDQMIVFYNRDTDTLVFSEPMGAGRRDWDTISSPNPPEGGPMKVDVDRFSITPLYNGGALALDRGYIYPATGGMNAVSPTMFSPLLTEALARLIDTFPDYGSWTVYEAPQDWAQGGRGYTARDWVYRFLDLRSAISSREAAWQHLTLYHGTCRHYADQIMRRGLQPRDTTGVLNPWSDSAASYAGLVYLSHGSRLTITRSAMGKAAGAAGWSLYGDQITALIDYRYEHSHGVADNFHSAVSSLRSAATGKRKTNWTREVPPDPEADALLDRIQSDRRLEPVLLEVNVPREGWANFERDEDTRRYSEPGAEMTGMPAWMLSLGSDAVVAYKGTIPPAWVSVAAEGAAATGAGMSSDDWSWRH